MSLFSLPDELLSFIMDYIPDNKGSASLAMSCVYFKKLFSKYGFLKNLTISPHQSLYSFSVNSAIHRRTLNMVTISHIYDPQYWIFHWPRSVHFNNCTTKSILNQTNITSTEILYIMNDNNKDIKINWTKFRNLKILKLTDLNVDLTGIEICKNLKYINTRKLKHYETVSDFVLSFIRHDI